MEYNRFLNLLGSDIKVCVSQDPVFGDIDKAFVELLGHEVVDDPEAFEVIDERNLRMG